MPNPPGRLAKGQGQQPSRAKCPVFFLSTGADLSWCSLDFSTQSLCKCLLWVVTHSPVLSEAARVQKSWARIRREEERIEQNRSDKFTSLTCPSVALCGFCWTLYSNISCTRIQILSHFINSLKFFCGSIVDLQCVNFCWAAK